MTTSKAANQDVHEAVRSAYGKRAATGSSCCGPAAGSVSAALKMGYTAEEAAAVPDGANLGLGCGAPLHAARVAPGETVLDLGSGAGFDALLAARVVGVGGRVIGVDMTPEMITKARANAERAGVSNVEFREGLIEALPVDDESVDVVISNCVINLSPDKAAVFREAFRVLKPGGRLAVSDIVLTAPLPEAVAQNMAAYVGCLAGAALLGDYVDAIRAAGFDEPEVTTKAAAESLAADDPIVKAATDAAATCCGGGADLAAISATVLSATVVATRP